MAEKDIVQNMIVLLGQSQDERMPRELDVHFADMDERTTGDLLRFTREFSRSVNHYPSAYPFDDSPLASWLPFFNYTDAGIDGIIADTGGQTSPHLALLLAFLELYKQPRELLNTITGRHLDFYYRDVLRLNERPAAPDRAHVLLELKKNAAPMLITPENVFSAGKDATGVELLYTPARETLVNVGHVASVRSIFLDTSGRGTIRHAPIANSSDGLGGAFTVAEPKWNGFGGTALPPGEFGFALAAPVLRMKEGLRTVTAMLTLGNVNPARLNNTALVHAFNVFLTGDKKWVGPIPVSPTINANGTFEFKFTIDEDEPAIIGYDAAVHGYAYASGAPVMQVLLRTESAAIGYRDVENVTLLTARLSVDVSNIKSLALESDAGNLDPKKAFMPFGPQPSSGARFMVGCSEALSKKLTRLSVTLEWKDAPAGGDFRTHYQNYGLNGVSNDYFTAGVKFIDGGGHQYSGTFGLFDSANALAEHEITLTSSSPRVAVAVSTPAKVYALSMAGSRMAVREASRFVLRMPVFAPARTVIPPAREGFVTFALNTDFLHATYRRRLMENVLAVSRGTLDALPTLNEPYTPAVQSISLSYSAHSNVANIASGTLDDFAAADVQFYHATPFGPRHEHGYLRRQFSFLDEKNVTLVPRYTNEGELYIGLADLEAGQSTSILFQVAEGSADPGLLHPTLEWSVLCDNYWKRLGTGELALDTTNGLLASGIVTIVVPTDATDDNTVLPAGHIWIRAAARRNTAAVCRLIEVAANAVEVRFTDNANDPQHLLSALAAKSITRTKKPLAVVKSVRQPYASFGGSPTETGDAFHTRVSERLRHKNRCITTWDYERVILEAFPRVHRVLCIPHANEGSWNAPGNVLIVVVPDVRNKNAQNPLEPRVDADTIVRITEHVGAHAGMQVKAKVTNPRYQKVRLDFKVRFHPGHEFNYYRNILEQELIRALSPWAFDASREIAFGGTIYKSVLLDVVEDLEYVDFVTDFKMYSYSGATNNSLDLNEVRARRPDVILVSDASHTITEVQ